MNSKTNIVFLALVIFLSGCPQPEGGGSPFEINPSIPQKKLVTNSAPLETVCYVDVEKYNPLNAKDYVFTASTDTPETQFFNYVVLGYSYLTKDARGYTHLEMTDTLRYILTNSITYIKPLHLRGIKVLIEVRSGIYDDAKPGIGAGFGTMDMASINEFTKELKLLVDLYGIDGFDFNDQGGGKNSYPPYTRDLKQFQSDLPLHPNDIFVDDDGNPLSDDEIEEVLWHEGGSNFCNLILRANEALKETYTSVWKNGDQETSDVQTVARIILVRNRNHGSYLVSTLRMAYMPDAYAGADPKITLNLRFIVNDKPYDTENAHAHLYDEAKNLEDVGADEADNRYIPFAIDLSNREERTEAEKLAKDFLYKDLNPNPRPNPDGSGSTSAAEYSSYGALFFTDLRPVSEAPSVDYINYFSRVIFGRVVHLADTPGAGDYKKTW